MVTAVNAAPRLGDNAPVTGDHYFSPQPGTADVRSEIEFTVAGRDYPLTAAAGVFSAGRLDPGTAVLLRKADLPASTDPGPFLDLGCGYGPITCVLADQAPAATVYAVDVNARARELTLLNADRLGVADRVRVADPDRVPPELTFTQLWSNPPIRVGKAELRALLARWLPRLAPGGVGWLVIARYLGGDSVQQWLREQGWQVDRHASQKGYRVLRVTHHAD
ncbi:16S rRNA m(2)G 1207 methyltransferase [Micromonospora sp. Llam0]|nr:16S rRNA m(2)G 1207 methyltransferase [Micromonospora sp. Llam0]